MIFDQNKKELLDNLYDERWHYLNYYKFMKHLTPDEIIILTTDIANMGYHAYFYGDDYIFNPNLLLFLSIFIKKRKVINHDYYGAIRYWAEFDDKDVP
jgi:hypothetical protein